MAAGRILHRKAGRGEKVTKLNDFEYRVWTQYILSADDFGVMRFSAISLQDDNDRLQIASERNVQKAFQRIVDVGLIGVFEHQGRKYVYQHDWQDWQKLEWTAETMQPRPPDDVLGHCTDHTRRLYSTWPGKQKVPTVKEWEARRPPDSVESQSKENREDIERQSRDRANTNTNTKTKTDTKTDTRWSGEDDIPERAGRFIERYAEMYHRIRGGPYRRRDPLEFPTACQLAGMWTDDAHLDRVAEHFLTCNHKFAREGNRTIIQFAGLANWCDEQVRGISTDGADLSTEAIVAAMDARRKP